MKESGENMYIIYSVRNMKESGEKKVNFSHLFGCKKKKNYPLKIYFIQIILIGNKKWRKVSMEIETRNWNSLLSQEPPINQTD